MKLAVAHAVPVGGFTGWRQAMPVTQWTVTKPHPSRPHPQLDQTDQTDQTDQPKPKPEMVDQTI